MANIRNNETASTADYSGTNARTMEDRWGGEVNPGGMVMDQDWNQPWTATDTRFGIPRVTMDQGSGMQMGQGGGMQGSRPMMQNNGMWMNQNQQMPQNNGLQMQNQLPNEVIESPTTVNEAFLGSLKATLMRNKGNYIVATFLIGTQNTVSWEGILYEVGNDYVTIYQPGRDRYVVSDMYSLKYMEFYDTRRREVCEQLMRANGMMPQGTQNFW